MKDRTTTDLRAEFWSLPDDAMVDRDTAAAALYLSKASLNAYAIQGNGPPYLGRGRGRNTLYQKKAVLDWLAQSGRVVHATAELGAA
jgi:hypothetical protein